MRAISNYIAAIITVGMIFTSIAFLISLTLRQAQVSTEAMNAMVEIAERAREKLGISYSVVDNTTVKLTLTNLGDIDIILSYVLVFYKDLSMQEIKLNNTALPKREVLILNIKLKEDFNNVTGIKILTFRGNIYDVFSSAIKQYITWYMADKEYLDPNTSFILRIFVENNLLNKVTLNTSLITLSFLNTTTDENITSLFKINSVFPDIIELDAGEKTTIVYNITYLGGVKGYTDLMVVLRGIDKYGNTIEQTDKQKEILYLNP